MPQRNTSEVTFRAHGVCDAVDGTNAPRGAMGLLSNLIPDPATTDVFVARPAAVALIDFVALGFAAPGEANATLVVGDTVYGMIPTARNALMDEPFCVNLATG